MIKSIIICNSKYKNNMVKNSTGNYGEASSLWREKCPTSDNCTWQFQVLVWKTQNAEDKQTRMLTCYCILVFILINGEKDKVLTKIKVGIAEKMDTLKHLFGNRDNILVIIMRNNFHLT